MQCRKEAVRCSLPPSAQHQTRTGRRTIVVPKALPKNVIAGLHPSRRTPTNVPDWISSARHAHYLPATPTARPAAAILCHVNCHAHIICFKPKRFLLIIKWAKPNNNPTIRTPLSRSVHVNWIAGDVIDHGRWLPFLPPQFGSFSFIFPFLNSTYSSPDRSKTWRFCPLPSCVCSRAVLSMPRQRSGQKTMQGEGVSQCFSAAAGIKY
jgi:hypothetical protein